MADGMRIVPAANVRYWGLTVARDSRNVYYLKTEKGVNTLYRVPMGGGASSEVMSDVYSPISLSPDGQRLAFIRLDFDRHVMVLKTANIDGTGQSTLATRERPLSSRFPSRGLPTVSWSRALLVTIPSPVG